MKLTFAGDVCRGLQYLASCRIVHRDIAARNVLLDAAYLCRIGDFGLSQSLSESKEYVRMQEQVAVRWAAKEVLSEDKFSTASDVWSCVYPPTVPFFANNERGCGRRSVLRSSTTTCNQ